jgi:ABC-type sugar transport system ATPase subunit
VRQLRAEGLAILYVSHKMEEIFTLGDRITVLRDGRTVTSGPAGDFTQLSLVKAMVGEDVDLYDHTSNRRDEVALEVRDVSRAGALAGINFTLHAGEILGLGGLVGSGRSELALAIFGADPIDGGEIRVAGKPVSLRSPVEAIAAGIGLVPEERKQQGIVDVLTVRENTTISILERLTRGGLLDLRRERSVARDFVRDLQVKTPTTETRIGGLSGGNQQKVVIARWLARQPRVLILDEPTKGIDVGAKAEIHRLIQRLAESGVAVLLISSELPELLALSDRVAVMREGRLVAILDRDDATKEAILGAAAAD